MFGQEQRDLALNAFNPPPPPFLVAVKAQFVIKLLETDGCCMSLL